VHVVRAKDLSTGWLRAVDALLSAPGHELRDLIVEIEDAQAEREEVRAAADELNQDLTAHSVANELFPQHTADRSRSRAELYQRYGRMLSRLRPASRLSGTYFARLIAYPGVEGPVNQLEDAIARLKKGQAHHNLYHDLYEMNIRVPGVDRRTIGFPCLSYLNVKLDRDRRVLITAHYRSHFFVKRAYGNYVGLARVQRFICAATKLKPGGLICVSGHARIERGIATVRSTLGELKR
jgi:thymidylate synthase